MKNQFFTLAFIIMAFFKGFAQAPDTTWTRTLGGSSTEWATSVSQTSDGGYIVAGYTNSNDGDVHGNHGRQDSWVIKLNNSGDTTWTKTLGGTYYEYTYSISQTSDNGYIMAGSSSSDDGDVHGWRGWSDVWVVKLNNSGDTIWTKTLGGSHQDVANSISQTSDGGYIVAGYTFSNDGDVHGIFGIRDVWIVKLNSNGDTTWTKTLGGSTHELAKSISQTTDGGYIVAGVAYSYDGDVHGFRGRGDYWIIKLNNSGDTTWTKTLGGSGNDYAFSISQTSDGGYIVAGSTRSNDGDVHGNHGIRDVWIVKLNNSGDTTWTKTLGGSGSDAAVSISQTSDGGYIVAGSTSSNDGDVNGYHGGVDSWIIKLNNSGDTTWTKTLGGSNGDGFSSISQTSDNGYIMAGSSSSDDGDVHGHQCFKDVWLVKLDPLNLPPFAECQNVSVSANENCEAFVTLAQVDNNSYDPDGDPITLSLDPIGPYQLGETTVTLTVVDDSGESDQCTATITVVDDTLPVITTIEDPITLWPPNHNYASFNLNDFVLSISDNCSILTIDDVLISRVTSDEPENANGGGDGNTTDDIVIGDDCKTVLLRKERSANGNGRVYTIYMELNDSSGNTGMANCHVNIPHSNNGTAIDDGMAYEVIGNCSNKSSFITAVDNDNINLTVYPNPTKGFATIAFTTPETKNTTLKIYNSQGLEVVNLYSGIAEAGQEYTFTFNSVALKNGVYTIHFQCGKDINLTKKVLLIK